MFPQNDDNNESKLTQFYDATLKHLPKLVQGCFLENDIQTNYECCTRIRKLLCKQSSPPIDTVIQTGVVPKFVRFVIQNEHEKLQFEALWAIANIASGSERHTSVIIKNGGVPAIIKCLSNTKNDQVLEQCVWTLGNIVGDSPNVRDLVLKSNGLSVLINKFKFGNKKLFNDFKILLKYDLKSVYGITNDIINLIYSYYFSYNNSSNNINLLRNFTWTLSNFCRGKPSPDLQYIKVALPVLVDLLYNSDKEILQDACWGFSYLSDFEDNRMKYQKEKELIITNCGGIKQLIELLGTKSPYIQHPALRCLGNLITSEDDKISTKVINLGLIPSLNHLIESDKPSLRKESCWILSNILACDNNNHIELVITHNLFSKLIKILNSNDQRFQIKKEAAWALSNATTKGNNNQLKYLINGGIIPALSVLLNSNHEATIVVCLEGLLNVLNCSEKEKQFTDGINKSAQYIEECGALNAIENILIRQDLSERVTKKANTIISTYFSASFDTNENDFGTFENEINSENVFQF